MKIFIFCFFSLQLLANTTVRYRGEAHANKDLKNPIIYIENHEVQYDSKGKLVMAVTKYSDPTGKPIAELRSDFKESMTVPAHIVTDFRNGNIQGLRRENGKLVMFDQVKGEAEKTKIITDKESEDRVLVGCQGLNYYVLNNLNTFDFERKVPIRFLIPGKLDYYDFSLEKTGEVDGILDFEIAIQSWILRLFAPKLYVKYDKNKKRIVWYQGLSNITNDKGETQNVTIEYFF
jgi:hypothetical protein